MKRFPLISIFFLSFALVAPQRAQALPFYQTPESMAQYFNTLSWQSGDKLYFQNLHNCFGDSKGYICNSGYVTVRSPKGTKVCDVYVSYFLMDTIVATKGANVTTSKCVYK
jgi:hypothetical protein